MKYANREIRDLTDEQLLAAYRYCGQQVTLRNEASKHDKFNKNLIDNGKIIQKMDFPKVNSSFTELEQELLNEIKKRKLEL